MINGKKYHVSPNILPPPTQAASGTKLGLNYDLSADGVLTLSGTTTTNGVISYTLSNDFVIPVSVSQGGSGAYAFNNTIYAPSNIALIFYYNDTIIDSWGLTSVDRKGTSYSAMGGKTINKITLQFNAANITVNGSVAVAFSNNGVPVSPYEPYDTEVWHDTPIPTRKLHNKTDVITSLPVDIYTDGQNASADIIGNMQQSGTPTPQTPIQPQECGDRTANWFDYKTAYAQYLSGDDIVITPIQMTSERQYFKASEVGKTITISVYAKTVTSNRVFIRASVGGTNINSNTVSRGNSGTLTVTVTPTSTSDFFNLTYGDGGDYNTFNKFMVNEGLTALPYEPYGYKLDIKSGNTTTPVYLGQVESARNVKQIILKGGEISTVDASVGQALLSISDRCLGVAPISSHYKGKVVTAWNQLSDGECGLLNNGTTIRICDTTNITSAPNYNQWLAAQYAAGTPVTIWYVLATETTTTLNEPLRKIGDYADSVTASNIPTTAGGIEFDVDTSLKPSEVSLTYHGWHDISPEQYENGVWN